MHSVNSGRFFGRFIDQTKGVSRARRLHVLRVQPVGHGRRSGGLFRACLFFTSFCCFFFASFCTLGAARAASGAPHVARRSTTDSGTGSSSPIRRDAVLDRLDGVRQGAAHRSADLDKGRADLGRPGGEIAADVGGFGIRHVSHDSAEAWGVLKTDLPTLRA